MSAWFVDHLPGGGFAGELAGLDSVLGFAAAVAEAVGLVAGLNDVAVVGQAIQ